MNLRQGPIPFHAGMALALSGLLAAGLWWLLGARFTLWVVVAAWLIGVNLAALGYYAWDKFQAGRAGRRIPEVVLHGLALAGGSLGAFAGMQWFRHKTVKGRFRVVFWVIVGLQLLVAVWVAHAWWTAA